MNINNRVQLIGYVGSDPRIKIFDSGQMLAVIRIATHKTMDESAQVISTWHNITAWGKLAEIAAGNFVKGSHIMVEGELGYRSIRKDRATIFFTNILAHTLVNLDR